MLEAINGTWQQNERVVSLSIWPIFIVYKIKTAPVTFFLRCMYLISCECLFISCVINADI